ncbi:hypothetical protein VTN77DRAFT_5172 [Rasamsonia byssochlamydoides]|uniref:uncharacterized protein n=1 Tax=Rasamsonia byssochlamydoides TaxID=89139 RepID=UPI0037447136
MASQPQEDWEEDPPQSMVASFFSTQSDLSSVPTLNDQRIAENKLNDYCPQEKDDATQKVLSSFLEFLPATGRQVLIQFIANISTNVDQVLYSLSNHLLTCILYPMKARSATPITPSPLPDNEETLEEIAAIMDQSPSRYPQGALKKLCLKRDNFRCIATGLIDVSAKKEQGVKCNTELAHVLPFSIGQWENSKDDHRVSQIWATLTKLFPFVNLRPSQINDPTNLMTLWSDAHKAFGSFSLAFDPTDETLLGQDDRYKVLAFGDGYPNVLDAFLPQPNANNERFVTFQAHTNTPLPSSVLLQTHAALAKVLHASGMGEFIDEVLEERDNLRCLARDGSSNIRKLLFAF